MATRRQVLAAAVLACGGGLTGCARDRVVDLPGAAEGGSGRQGAGAAALSARVPSQSPAGPPPEPGTRPLGVVEPRDALLHVPPGLPPDRPLPLVVTLHGAGGDAEAGLALLRGVADERGWLLLAPASREATWDAIRGSYGPDVRTVDRALEEVFSRVPVDPGRIAVAGFSDGASYALGLGLANGDLFGRIVALSPGFVPEGGRSGTPAVFIAHGEADDVLPIDRSSRRIVPRLREDGLEVTYSEFAGGHAVPPEVVREAADWLGWGGPA